MTGYAGLGAPRSEPLIRNENMHEAIANVSVLRGNHAFEFGGRPAFPRRGRDGQPARRESRLDAGISIPAYTRNPAATGGTGDAMASMILGYPLALRRDVLFAGIRNPANERAGFLCERRLACNKDADAESWAPL